MQKLLSLFFILSVIFLPSVFTSPVRGERLPLPEGYTIEGPRSLNRALALVGDSVITLRDYRSQFKDTQITRPRLDHLIDQALIDFAASDMGISITDENTRQMVDQRLEAIINSGGEEQFRSYLEAEGLTEKQFREQMQEQSKSEMLLSQVIARSFPEFAVPDTFTAGARLKARLMIIDDRQTANEVFEKLGKKPTEEEWNRLYEEHSRPQWFVGEYGKLDWFGWGSFHEDIEYHLFKLPLYALSEPFHYRGDYLLVWKTGIRYPSPGTAPEMEELQYFEQLRQKFYHERLLELLRDHYAVEIPDSVLRQIGGEDNS
ncbi:MAG: SurA N-terminal domain-containing protein [bacterium]